MDPFLAVELSDLKALREALAAGADVHQEKDGLTLLHYAIDVESDAHTQTDEPLHVDMTALLLAWGADPQRRSGGGSGVSAEHMAALSGHWLALELFKGWQKVKS
jgi:uncharacterized protein